ncbi:MAG: hypothetical protein KAW49_08310, partial [Anaerolineae bacterium]|nr:hypothetical protein [Anaerolineae bacterium]
LEQVVEAARTRLAWARALLARGKTARGREMLQAALVIFDEAGAAPEVEQVRRALTAHPVPQRQNSLSPRKPFSL